jgi:hypothetical protein
MCEAVVVDCILCADTNVLSGPVATAFSAKPSAMRCGKVACQGVLGLRHILCTCSARGTPVPVAPTGPPHLAGVVLIRARHPDPGRDEDRASPASQARRAPVGLVAATA